MKDIMDFMNSDYNECTCLNKLPLAYSYTPMQEIDTVYSYEEGLNSGTIFP
ncbi:MAG: spore coat associated protein CotJA, partial [Clostridia bacterium]